MELKELKCKNCGASLEVEKDATEVTCKFCNTTFSVESNENLGYEFEKGRIKAQKEELGNKLNNVKDALPNINEKDVKNIAKGFGIVYIVVVVIIIVSFGFFAFFVTKQFTGHKGALSKSFNEFEVESFNNDFYGDSGTKSVVFVKNTLDTVVTINKTKKDHIITVVYNDVKTSDPDAIVDLKQSLNKSEYEVGFDYDDVGFINKVTLSDVK